MSERTRKIGVRSTIGAEPADVPGMVVRRALSLTAWVGAALFLALVVLAASSLLGLRASWVDPAEALRRGYDRLRWSTMRNERVMHVTLRAS